MDNIEEEEVKTTSKVDKQHSDHKVLAKKQLEDLHHEEEPSHFSEGHVIS